MLVGLTLLISCQKRTGNEVTVLSLNTDFFPKEPTAPHPDLSPIQDLIQEHQPDAVFLQEWDPTRSLFSVTPPGYTNHLDSFSIRNGNTAVILQAQRAELYENVVPAPFTIRGETMEASHGIIHSTIRTSEGALHLINIHLHDRMFHPLGQSRVRRNEARVIRQYIDEFFEKDPKAMLLLTGSIYSEPDSEPIDYLTHGRRKEPVLLHLIPLSDDRGHRWTYHQQKEDAYFRMNYALATTNLIPYIDHTKSGILSWPESESAQARHRPLKISIRFP